jgi:hypothetical protein
MAHIEILTQRRVQPPKIEAYEPDIQPKYGHTDVAMQNIFLKKVEHKISMAARYMDRITLPDIDSSILRARIKNNKIDLAAAKVAYDEMRLAPADSTSSMIFDKKGELMVVYLADRPHDGGITLPRVYNSVSRHL